MARRKMMRLQTIELLVERPEDWRFVNRATGQVFCFVGGIFTACGKFLETDALPEECIAQVTGQKPEV